MLKISSNISSKKNYKIARTFQNLGVCAIEASDSAVGKYLSQIEGKRVLQLLKANEIRFNSFGDILNSVRNMDEATFSRLIRESTLTPELDLDLLIRAARKLDPSARQELILHLNYRPRREDLIRILKEVGKKSLKIL